MPRGPDAGRVGALLLSYRRSSTPTAITVSTHGWLDTSSRYPKTRQTRYRDLSSGSDQSFTSGRTSAPEHFGDASGAYDHFCFGHLDVVSEARTPTADLAYAWTKHADVEHRPHACGRPCFFLVRVPRSSEFTVSPSARTDFGQAARNPFGDTPDHAYSLLECTDHRRRLPTVIKSIANSWVKQSASTSR